jgi:hypothetical protein
MAAKAVLDRAIATSVVISIEARKIGVLLQSGHVATLCEWCNLGGFTSWPAREDPAH